MPTANIDSLTLNSVFDNQDQSADRINWFELYQPSADFWNIRTTSDFVNEAWYRDTNGANTFKFNFTAVVTEPGKETSTTIIEEVGSLINICPIIYEDDGTTDVTNGTVTLPQTSPLESLLVTVKARNGANIPNAEKDLSWAIKSAVNSSGNPVPFGNPNVVPGSYFSISQIEDATGHYKECKLYNNKIQEGDLIPVDTYTIVLKVEDADPCEKEVTIEAQIGTQPNQIRYKYWGPNTAAGTLPRQAMQIHITDSGPLNGYYLWKGNEEQWLDLVYSASSSGLIEIQNTNAYKSTDPNPSNCSLSKWIYSPTEAGAQGLYEICEGEQLYGFGNLVATDVNFPSNSMQWLWLFKGTNYQAYPQRWNSLSGL